MKSGECSSLDGVCPYWTAEKQWGLQATENLDAGSLVLEEEAVAAVSDLITFSDLRRLLVVTIRFSHWLKVVVMMSRTGRHHHL